MAKVKVLVEGDTHKDAKRLFGEDRNCATISLVVDKNIVMVVDPGVVDSPQILIDALAKEGLTVNDINFVCVTNSHLPHYKTTARCRTHPAQSPPALVCGTG